MEGTGRFDIYLPSGYVGSGKKYPVLYLLHGLGYNPGIWESRMNLTRLVDEFVRDGAIEPILLSRILSMFDAYVQTDDFTENVLNLLHLVLHMIYKKSNFVLNTAVAVY